MRQAPPACHALGNCASKRCTALANRHHRRCQWQLVPPPSPSPSPPARAHQMSVAACSLMSCCRRISLRTPRRKRRRGGTHQHTRTAGAAAADTASARAGRGPAHDLAQTRNDRPRVWSISPSSSCRGPRREGGLAKLSTAAAASGRGGALLCCAGGWRGGEGARGEPDRSRRTACSTPRTCTCGGAGADPRSEAGAPERRPPVNCDGKKEGGRR